LTPGTVISRRASSDSRPCFAISASTASDLAVQELDVAQAGAQLFVTGFHGRHRILEVREGAIGRTDRFDRAGDETGRALRA
jgi:hypothetical protein